MKFRKKPIVIEAEQFLPGKPVPAGVCFFVNCGAPSVPHVHTIHDDQTVGIVFGDWILPEPDGMHYYPCKPEIFAATYEPLESAHA